MPELPEVEITRRGLEEHLVGATIVDVVVRNPKLRWPIPDLPVQGCVIKSLKRRAKYLLLDCGNGTLILHLGMSGSLRILPVGTPAALHDHFDLILNNGKLMRLRDPRRFGAVLWHEGDINTHPLLASLGPEPLEENFHARYLHQALRGRTIAIKQAIMDNHLVVGVGNIYANESLFRSGIKPTLAAGKLSLARCEKLVIEIRATLHASIAKGGSTLRDFVHSDGSSGYFQQEYFVYGRANEACRTCGTKILQIKQGQRSSFYCGVCQK
ncbi:MAG: formamidopyrimidine-DNA glycosylase [Pseudomonadota bacterium]|jgi:formamidopyrimidine-DNA glycosylase